MSAAEPELGNEVARTTALATLRKLMVAAELDAPEIGSPQWNPLSDLIRRGQKVVIKPNWVMHRNSSGCGLDSLVTHTSVLEAIVAYVLKAAPASVMDHPAAFHTLVRLGECAERRGIVHVEFQDRLVRA